MRGNKKLTSACYLLVMLLILYSFTGCNPCHGDDRVTFRDDNVLVFTIYYGNSGVNVFQLGDVYENIDTFKVLNEQGELQAITKFQKNGTYYFWLDNFFNKSSGQDPFRSTVCKKYVFYYDYQDLDTLGICYSASFTDCGSELRYFEARYNEVQMPTEIRGSAVRVDISK